MKNKSKRRLPIATKTMTDRSAKTSVRVGDLPVETDRTRSATGGVTIAGARPRTAVYQPNQTDLEFVR